MFEDINTLLSILSEPRTGPRGDAALNLLDRLVLRVCIELRDTDPGLLSHPAWRGLIDEANTLLKGRPQGVAATASPTPAESRVADMAEPKSEAEPTCVHCGRELEYREYGPPINDTTWSHVHNGVVWCHWPTTPEKAREVYVAPAERTQVAGEQETK